MLRIGSFVVGVSYCPETFLPCGVPNLQFNILGVHLKSFKSKVHPNGRNVTLIELVICEPQQYGGFPNSTVSDDH